MNPPRVSYVVASYNHQAYVRDALLSILHQTYGDLELVVVDDGSSDNTLQIARDIAAIDPRVRVYAQDNRGVVIARNRGVQHARGEYVSIVDSDDLLPPRRTEWQVAALDDHPQASLVYGDAWLIDRNGDRIRRFFEIYPPLSGDFSSELYANYCFVPAVSVMFRRAAFEHAGSFWGPGPSTDYLKWIELGMFGPAICLPDRQLGYWRLHGRNASTQPARRRTEMYENLREALQQLVERYPELGERIGDRRLRRRYGRCHFMGALYAALERSWDLAGVHFAKAFGYDPSLLNGAAWLSSLPLINLFSGPCYSFVARRRNLC